MRYEYYVSYHFSRNNNSGFGSCGFQSDSLIDSMEKLDIMRNQIQEQFEFSGLIIISFQLLRAFEQ